MAKSTKPMVRIHNTETDEVIDREMTDAEFGEYQADQKAQAAALLESQAKAATKSALLDRLNLTEDEAKLLLS
jgi:hypothetical protein